jgi:hypothetical protein
MLFGKTAITFAYELGLRRILYENSSTENFTHEIYCRGIFAEIRFPKNGLEYGVLGVRSLDVVAPNFVLRDHV